MVSIADVLAKWVDKLSDKELLTILSDSETPLGVIMLLAGHKRDWVRAKAALHPNCPDEVRQKLASDKSHHVRMKVRNSDKEQPCK